MNELLRRRISMIRQKEPSFSVLYPGYWYFEITTTTDNYWIDMFVYTPIQKYILDGVDVTSSCSTYGPSQGWEFGRIKIPTAGRHKIWIAPTEWAYLSEMLGPIGMDIIYVGDHISSYFDAPHGVVTLYITKTTPPEQPGSNNFANLAHIYVPKNLVNTYKSAWSNWANSLSFSK